jgi:hypothetical protein
MDALPDWPPGTAAVLSTAGGAPHAIPVSTAQRAGPLTILFALARRRASLERLRTDPRCALTILAAPDLAFTAHGRAAIVEDASAGRVTALRLDVESIQDHTQPTFTIEAGVRWRWTDPDAEAADAEVRAALAALAR